MQAWRVSRYLECDIADVSSVCVSGSLNQLGAVNKMEHKKGPGVALDRSMLLNKGYEQFCSCSYDCLCSDIEAFISTGLLLC